MAKPKSLKSSSAAAQRSLVVAKPSVGDLVVVRRLFRQALRQDFQYFPSAYTDRISRQNRLHRLIAGRFKPSRVMYVAKASGRVVGYALGSLTAASNGELYWLYVDPACRTRNIGAALLQAIIDDLQRRQHHKLTLVTYDLRPYYERFSFHHRGQQHIHGLNLDVMEYDIDGA